MSSSPLARDSSARSAWVSAVPAVERVEHGLLAVRPVEHARAPAQLADPEVGDHPGDQRDDRDAGGAEGDLVEQRTMQGQHRSEA